MNSNTVYSSIPAIMLATVLTILVMYFLSDITKNKDRAVLAKNLLFS